MVFFLDIIIQYSSTKKKILKNSKKVLTKYTNMDIIYMYLRNASAGIV